MGYIDIDLVPDPAASAARATARTRPTWDSWAGTTTRTLRSIATSSRDSQVTGAFETFLQDVNPRVQALPALAEKQGVDLGSAVHIAVDADHQAASDLKPLTQRPLVNRPINVGP